MHNDDLLDPMPETEGNAALDTSTLEESHVSEGEDTTDAAKVEETSAAKDSGGDTADTEPPSGSANEWSPSRKLLEKMGELLKARKELESVRAQKKASAAAYADREKALDAQVGELTQQVDDESWHEEFDVENGIVHRTNRLTGETETRPYSPPAQQALPFDRKTAPELEGVTVGLCGQTEAGVPLRVQAIAADSVVIEFPDGRTERVSAAEWAADCAPKDDIDQQEYVDAFETARDSLDDWQSDVLEALSGEPSMTFAGIIDAVAGDEAWDHDADTNAVRTALHRLIEAGKVVCGTGEDCEYSLAPEEPTDKEQDRDAYKLLSVADSEGMTVDELVEASALPKARVKALCSELVTSGYLSQGARETGKRGRKPTIFSITDEGQAHLEA